MDLGPQALVGGSSRNVASLTLVTLHEPRPSVEPDTLNAQRIGSNSPRPRNTVREVPGRIEAVVTGRALDTAGGLVVVAVDTVGDGDSASALEASVDVASLALSAVTVALVKVVDVAVVGGWSEVLIALTIVIERPLVAPDAAVTLSVAEDAAFGASVAVLPGEGDQEQKGDGEGD